MNKKRLCIFAHFNPYSRVEQYVFYYLQQLRDFGVDIIFSSSSIISNEDREKLSFCLRILIRENKNYDFGSWKDGLNVLSRSELQLYDELIIANDSCFGPLVPFASLWAEMNNRSVCDFWGITDCVIYTRYIESYFVVFRKSAFTHPFFEKFWDELPDFKYKHDVVVQGEQQLTKKLVYGGLRFDTYIHFSYAQRFLYACYYKYRVLKTLFVSTNRKFIKSKLEPIEGGQLDKTAEMRYAMKKLLRLLAPFHFNPLLLAPLGLLQAYPLEPFVKKMLLRKNPLNIDVEALILYIGLQKDYPISLLRENRF